MVKFYATIEFLSGQSAAILTLTDQAGEWAGSGRVEGRTRSTIYERAYALASLSAQGKGGILERFSRLEPPRSRETFRERAGRCTDRVEVALARRPANALNVEIGKSLDRCRLQTPPEWGTADPRATRWLWSGGSPLILDPCACATCPKGRR